MFLPKPSENAAFELTPAGTFVGICYRFLDKGTQMSEFNGERKQRREVMLTWELPTELMQDQRPFSISKTYTWSMHEKAGLRKDLESWRGRAFTDEDFEGPKAFNAKNLLGKACTLSITHVTRGDKTYANVSSIGKVMKGIDIPPLVNPITYLALLPNEFDAAVFGGLSDKLKETIGKSPEYAELMKASRQHDDPGGYAGHDLNDDIPF